MHQRSRTGTVGVSMGRIRQTLARFSVPEAGPPTRRDVAITLVWLVFVWADTALENTKTGLTFTNADPTSTWTFVALVPFTATLLFRRRAPLLAMIAAFLLYIGLELTGAQMEKGFLPIFVLALLTWHAGVAGRSSRDLALVAGVSGVLFVPMVAVTLDGPFEPGDLLWGIAMVTALPLMAARAFQHHERLRSLATERAAALEAQRDEEARRAVAEERERIAAELHDVIAHGVSAMAVQATAARRLVAARGATPDAHQAIGAVESSGRAALDELRRLLGVLRRGDEALALAPQPSLQRVGRLVERLRAEGLPVELTVEGEALGLPPGLDVTAYRILEEALADVLRTQGDAPARVTIRYRSRELELEVADEARGERSPAGDAHGLRERVALFGGELHAGRRRGGPWVLRARLPVAEAA
jgi:signal transduction histidine kinase